MRAGASSCAGTALGGVVLEHDQQARARGELQPGGGRIHPAPHRTGVHGTRPGIFCDCTGLGGLGGGIVDLNLRHERIPPRSPNHNAVCERFHGTILQECWRPAFHRRHFTSIRQLQGEADAWLITYHRRRRNHGDYMRGRTPQEVFDNHKKNKAA